MCFMKKYFFSLLILTCLFGACSTESVSPPQNEGSKEIHFDDYFTGKVFFDLPDFLDAERENFLKGVLPVEKTVVLNGASETQTLDSLDWELELGEFYKSDINKPSLMDKYAVREITFDTIGVRAVTYDAKEGEDVAVRQMDILFSEEKATSVTIVKETKNMLNEGQKRLSYSRNGYEIKNIRSSLGGTTDTLEIKSMFKI